MKGERGRTSQSQRAVQTWKAEERSVDAKAIANTIIAAPISPYSLVEVQPSLQSALNQYVEDPRPAERVMQRRKRRWAARRTIWKYTTIGSGILLAVSAAIHFLVSKTYDPSGAITMACYCLGGSSFIVWLVDDQPALRGPIAFIEDNRSKYLPSVQSVADEEGVTVSLADAATTYASATFGVGDDDAAFAYQAELENIVRSVAPRKAEQFIAACETDTPLQQPEQLPTAIQQLEEVLEQERKNTGVSVHETLVREQEYLAIQSACE